MVRDGQRTAALGRGGAAESRVESAVLTIARLIGRQIAREAFEASEAVNDNARASETGPDRETR